MPSLAKARNFSHTPLIKGSETAHNMMARRGTSLEAGIRDNILAPSNSIAPSGSGKKFGTKRKSEVLPRLGAGANRFS